MLTSKGLLLAGSWVAVVFALIATSGVATAETSEILLASGVVIALMLTRGTRRD